MTRAIIYRSTGGPEVLEYIDNYKVAPRKPKEVRVAVKSTSFNPVDKKTRQGGPGRKVELPKVPGGDLAGIVLEADSDSEFKADEPVIAFTNGAFGFYPNGTWTEQVNVPEEWLAHAPTNLSLEEEAGAIPLISLTAFQALSGCNLKPGDRVLIHAGSGGVGHMAVQLAKQYWNAYAVSTARNVDFVKKLGADEVVDYSKEDFAEKYKNDPFDAIVDLVGGDSEVKSYGLLKKGGTFAHIRNTGTDMDRVEAGKKWSDKKYTYNIVQPNGKQLGIISKLIADGKIKPHVVDVIPLERAREAEDFADKKKYGKIVIRL